MPLTTLDRVMSWCKKETLDASRQPELTRSIVAASKTLARVTGRQMERVTRSINLDGYDAGGQSSELLMLPRGDRPVLHTGGDFVTVTENGIAVTVLTGYTTQAGVVVKDANQNRQCVLIRTTGYWLPGYQNILVGYKCGWALDVVNDPQPVPDEVIQLANCLSWMIFQEPAWLGKLNVSSQGAAVTLSNELPESEAAILSSLVIR